MFLGGKDIAGKKMKSRFGWKNKNGGNDSGFSGLPAGLRFNDGEFAYFGENGNWWSSIVSGEQSACGFTLDYRNNNLKSYNNHMGIGLSIRCIKN